MKKNILVLLFLVSAASAFAVYYNALSNGFIWDDPIVLRNQLSAFRSVKDVFFPPPGIPQFGIHYYRPMIIVTLLIDKKIWGSTPFGFHLSVILFHVINTILVYFIARLIMKKYGSGDFGAFVASLLFAVHPIHTESVSWMAGRSDVVAAMFFFASLLLYLHYVMRSVEARPDHQGWLYFLLPSAALFFFAAAAKETSLSLILLLPIINIAFSQAKPGGSASISKKEKGKKKEKKKKKKQADIRVEERRKSYGGIIYESLGKLQLASYIPFVIAAIIYFMLRHSALEGQGQKVMQSRSLLDIPLYFLNSYGFYLEKLFLPFNLKAYIPEVPGGTLYTLYSALTFFGLLFLSIWFLMRRRELFFFIILFFIVTILPSISVALMKISETPLAERYLYIPSLSLSLIAGFITRYIAIEGKDRSVWRVAVSAALVLILVAMTAGYSIQTVKRNPVWKDDVLFWEDIVRKLPDEGLPHLNLGLAYNDRDRLKEAEREYIKAINAKYDDEGRSTAYNNLGNVYLAEKDYDKADEYFKTSISIRPSYPTPYYSMALTRWRKYFDLRQKGQAADLNLMTTALDYLNKALQLNPQYLKAHLLIGNIYLFLQQYDKARMHLETVLKYEQEGDVADMAKKLLDKVPSQ